MKLKIWGTFNTMSLTGAKMRWKDWSGGGKKNPKEAATASECKMICLQHIYFNSVFKCLYINLYIKTKLYLQLNQSADPLFISLKKNELVKWA